MTTVVVGALLGATVGAGLSIAAVASPPLRRLHLDDRLAPYLGERARPSRLLVESTPAGRRVVRRLAHRLDVVVGGSASVLARLDRRGPDAAGARSVEQFRTEQVAWGGAGLLAGFLLASLLAASGHGASPLLFVVLSVTFAIAGALARDRRLTAEVARREQRMLAELPAVAEMLALAVAAGEGPASAIERVTRLAHGELVGELRRVLAEVRAGVPLVTALDATMRRTTLPALSRFIDGIVIAIERGTPLADVLRAQASDVREAARRSLLDAAGRKEIAMLVPVVFLVLPTTVAFALFPGFYNLSLVVP